MTKFKLLSLSFLIATVFGSLAAAATEVNAAQERGSELVKALTADCQSNEALTGGHSFKACHGDENVNVTLWITDFAKSARSAARSECKIHEVTYTADHAIAKLVDEVVSSLGTTMKTSGTGDLSQGREVVITGHDGAHLSFTLKETEHGIKTSEFKLDNASIAKPSAQQLDAFYAARISASAFGDKPKVATNSDLEN